MLTNMEFSLENIKVEYEPKTTSQKCDLNPILDWKLNPNVECRRRLERKKTFSSELEFHGHVLGPTSMSESRTSGEDIVLSEFSKLVPKVEDEISIEEFSRDPLQAQNPIDSEIEKKFEVEHYTTSDAVDDLHIDEGLYKLNSKPESINSEQMELNGFNLDLLRCERDCGTCQKYIRKLSEHVRATHVLVHPNQPTLDPLDMDQSSVIEIKSEVNGDIERIECHEKLDLNLNSDPDYNPSPDLTRKSDTAIELSNDHMREHNSRKEEIICDSKVSTGKKLFKCGKGFSGMDSLTVHMQRHIGGRDRPFKCEQCDKRFAKRYPLTIHLRCHTGEKPFTCGVCGNSFARKHCLKTHMMIHTGERLHKCEHCDMNFKRKGHLTLHRMVHIRERPFKCQLCDKSYRAKSNLTVHMRTHTGERPFNCEQCGKSFNSSSDLKIHVLRRHTQEKPYKCQECDMSFATTSDAKVHRSGIHIVKKPYTCDQCGECFTSITEMSIHRITHGKEKHLG